MKGAILGAAIFAVIASCRAADAYVTWSREVGSFDALIVTAPPELLNAVVEPALARLGLRPDDAGVCHFEPHEEGLVAYAGPRPERVRLRVRVMVGDEPSGSRVTCTVKGYAVVDGKAIEVPSSGIIERRFFEALYRELVERN